MIAPKAVPAPRKAPLAEPTPAPIAEPRKAKGLRRSKIEALVAKLAEVSTPSRAKREARRAISEAGVRLTFRQRRVLRHRAI